VNLDFPAALPQTFRLDRSHTYREPAMSLLVLQHEGHESPMLLGRVLQGHGHRLRTIRLDLGEPLPADLDDVDGIVAMGGSANVDEVGTYPWLEPEMAYLKQAHAAGRPIVGVCLGAQLIAAALGGKVAAMAEPEVGWKPVKLAFAGTTDPLLAGVPWETVQFHLHGQEVTQLPPEGVPLAGSARCKLQAFRVGLTTYAFQYHFECDHAGIARFASDDLVSKAGEKADVIVADCKHHFAAYRRLGDRLAENIAMLLFPIDKRVVSGRRLAQV
jgi:GMP synthase-like glutamine amidotransferase